MTLRERIKDLCKKKGISVNKLEMDLHFGKGYVSKLDKSTPNSEKLQKIADYLGVTLDYLMSGEKEEFNKWSSENALILENLRADIEMNKAILKYFKLSNEKKKHVVELINLLDREI